MKTTSLLKTIILFLLITFAACSPLRSNHISFGSLDAEHFSKLIQKDNVTLVDVRTSEEFSAGHIEGAKHNIDVRKSTFIDDAKKILPNKGIIAVYCKGGVRSKTAASQLAAHGYKVVELSTGYDGWIKSGGKTTN